MTLGGGVLNCWAKKQNSVALSSWESELFAAITSGTRSLGIQGELMLIDHSKRRGHSVGSKPRWSEGTLLARSSSGWGNWSLKRWTLQ